MSNVSRGIVLVCEDEDARRLAAALGEGGFASSSLATLPEDADVASAPAFLWVRPSQLKRPADRDSVEYRSWLQFWTLYSSRVIVRLFRVGMAAKGGSRVSFLSEADAWMADAEEIQTQVRDFRACSIVVFERQPAQGELQELDRRSKTSAIYLMMPRLRVSREEKQQVFSIYIWPSAVGAALQRFALAVAWRDSGLFAWRSFTVHAKIVFGSDSAEDGVVDDFIRWIKDVRTDETNRRKETALLDGLRDPGEFTRVPSTSAALNDFSPGLWWDKLGNTIARLRRMLGADDFAVAIASEEDKGSAPPNNSAPVDRLISTVEQDDREMLADFDRLSAGPDRDPRGIVQRMTDISLVARQAEAVGLEIRRKASGTYSSPINLARQEAAWRNTVAAKPPLGGPGLLLGIQISADTQIELAREREMVGRMLELWERELSRRLRDHETEKQFLSRCADEVALTRRSMIGLGPRALLAVMTVVMLTATLLQGLRLWLQPQAGIWSLQEIGLAVLFMLMAGAGAVSGVLIPYGLERKRGRDAGEKLAAESAALVEERIATLNRRLVLAGYAQQVMAPNMAGLGRAKLVSRLAARSWTICKDVFERGCRLEGGLELGPAAGEETLLDAPGRFALRAYQQLSVYRWGLATSKKDSPRTEAEEKEERESWADHLAGWREKMTPLDFKSAGWMPRDEIVRLLTDALRTVRLSRLKVDDIASVGWESKDDFLEALNRWSPKGDLHRNMGMMSLHFVAVGGVKAFTLVAGQSRDLGERLKTLLLKRCDIKDALLVESSSFASLPGKPVALVFQEMRVEFREKLLSMAESDGFEATDSLEAKEATVKSRRVTL